MAARTAEQIKSDNETRLRRAKAWAACATALHETESAKKPGQMSPQNTAFVEVDDYAVRFVFWWIAFEALYARRKDSGIHQTKTFIKNMINCDVLQLDSILDVNADFAYEIVKLRQTHDGFWINRKYKNKTNEEKYTYPSYKSWENGFYKQVKKYEKGDTKDKLNILFDRLHVIRNQIFHGANSRATSWGITQVKDGVQLLSAFVPFFIEQLEKYPNINWGEIPFPRVGKENNQQDDLLPIWEESKND